MTEKKFTVGRYAETGGGDRMLIVNILSLSCDWPVLAVDACGYPETYTLLGINYINPDSPTNLVTLLPPECDSFDWEPADEDDEPSCHAVDVLETHRLLELGEVLQDGDEYQSRNGNWCPSICPGGRVQFQPYRRPLPTVFLLAETTQAAWDTTEDKWEINTTSPAKLLVAAGTVPGGRLFFLADDN